jgi:hypothetical protein
MTTYAPLDILKHLGEGIWIVDSGPLHAVGVIPLPVRMTTIRSEASRAMTMFAASWPD